MCSFVQIINRPKKRNVSFAENDQITLISDQITHISAFDDEDLQKDIEMCDREVERAMNQPETSPSSDKNNNPRGEKTSCEPPSVEEDLNGRVVACLREMKTNMCRIKARIFVRNFEQTQVDLRKIKQKLEEIYREKFAGKGSEEVADQVKKALLNIAEKEKAAAETVKKHGALLGDTKNLTDSERATRNYSDWNQLSSQCFYLNSVMLKGHNMAGTRSKKDLDEDTRSFVRSFGYRAAKSIVQTVLNEDMSVSLIINKIEKLLEEAKHLKETKFEVRFSWQLKI